MKLSKKNFVQLMVAILIVTPLVPTRLVFSAEGYLDSGEEDDVFESIVMVRHKDEFGNDLLPFYVASRNQPGEIYVVTSGSEQLPQYDLIATKGNAVGFHGEEDIEVIFIYRRRPVITITSDTRVAQPGDVINYTIVIRNDSAGVIMEPYTVLVQFDQRFSSMLQSEFALDYLAIGDNVLDFSMTINQNAAAGNKEVMAILKHPDLVGIVETSATTMIEIEVTDDSALDEEFNSNENDGLLEDVDSGFGGYEVGQSLMMGGMFMYDVMIIGAVIVKLFWMFSEN